MDYTWIGSDYEIQLGCASQNDTRKIRGARFSRSSLQAIFITPVTQHIAWLQIELIGQSIPGSYVTFEFHIYTAKSVGKRTFER